jgi:hypothetical protein
MTNRKKKLRLIQLSLLIIGSVVFFYSYSQIDRDSSSNDNYKKLNKNKNLLSEKENNSDTFYNIQYSGIDLAGNRYILKSEEAIMNKNDQKLVNMKKVDANFYFKDNTVLKVTSEKGLYNNESLDMIFEVDVKAHYLESKLSSQKAEYLNSKSFLIISKEVKLIDPKGNINADKVLLDINNKRLNIEAFKNDRINANINLK